jgi:hydrogenase-4 component E
MLLLSEIMIMLLVLMNFRLLATSRLAACIQTVALQAFLLGGVALATTRPGPALAAAALALLVVAVKGVLLPWLLRRTMRSVGVRREIEPMIGFTASVLIGAALLGLCFMITVPLQQSAAPWASLMIPGALVTILAGLFIIVSRRKALTQVIGFLTMENGVYAFGVALALEEPLLLEMGILLDVLVAVFIMGIAIHSINREFDHIDTDRLSALKE